MHIKMKGRHLLVGLTVALLAGLAGFGLIGPAAGTERITSYDVVATVNPDRSVSIREVIDWDFGFALDKHGIFRDIPTDAGVPQEIRVWSPDAPDGTLATRSSGDIRIRIGDPDTVVRGRHRYVITYVLPEIIKEDRFALDAIGDRWPVPVENVRVTLIGTELDEPRCFVGPSGSDARCPFSDGAADGYRTQVDRLDAGEAVTIEGVVLSPAAPAEGDQAPVADGVSSAAAGSTLPPFVRRDTALGPRWAAIVAGLGSVVALLVFNRSRHRGRNEVAVGGATAAAFAPTGDHGFGFLPTADDGPAPVATTMVADADMAALAGLDFVPPPGVEPWQAAVVLREKVDSDTIGAWFSSQAAHDIISFATVAGTVHMAAGPRAAEADAETAAVLNQAMGSQRSITLGSFDPKFAAGWNHAAGIIRSWSSSSGAFRHGAPSSAGGRELVIGLGVGLGVGLPLLFAIGFLVGLQTAVAAVAVTVFVVGVLSFALYSRLVPSLSAGGSAIWLRTESFRRFLHESEAQHVEWAWQNGLLREYSAWAVALGEAGAWGRALEVAGVPPVEVDHIHSVMAPSVHSSSFSSSHTAPSSSGGGGGGGSGGGGGGGGGGSW